MTTTVQVKTHGFLIQATTIDKSADGTKNMTALTPTREDFEVTIWDSRSVLIEEVKDVETQAISSGK